MRLLVHTMGIYQLQILVIRLFRTSANIKNILLLHLTLLHLSNAAIIKGPEDAVYKNHHDTSATLMCTVNTPVDRILMWETKKRVMYSNRGLNLSPEDYSYTGDNLTGVYTMTIHNLTREDSGEYDCQYGQDIETAMIIVAGKYVCIDIDKVQILASFLSFKLRTLPVTICLRFYQFAV